MPIKKYLLITTFALALAACSSTQATQYYSLPDSTFTLAEKQTQKIGVNIVLAEPVRSGHLLYQTDAYILNFAQKNVWAAPLEEMLASSLSNKLNQMSTLQYLPAKMTEQAQLTVYIDRFQGSYTGETEINGYAKWLNGKTIPFHVYTPQYGNGYPAMLDSLNKGLTSVAKQIAQ